MTTAPFTFDNQTHNSELEVDRLVTISLRWDDHPLLDILQRVDNQPRVFWESGQVTNAYAGIGASAILTAAGPTRFEDIRHQTRQLFENVHTVNQDVPSVVKPRLFGGFAFNTDHNSHSIWSAFPSAYFILPTYQFTRCHGQVWLTINIIQPESASLPSTDAHLEALRQLLTTSGKDDATLLQVCIEPLTEQSHWEQMVADAVTRIRRGDLEKVVLARASQVTASHQIDPIQALINLEQRYTGCHRFLIEPQPGHAFYGATPELLAELNDSNLNTVALAGSIKRGPNAVQDQALAHELFNNPKERQEHHFVVKAIEQHVRPLVTDLTIDPQPFVHKLHNIQHLKTGIRGRVVDGIDILDVVEALHPTPAVGGTPQIAAQRLITKSEKSPRGWYASPVGWIDDRGDGMFAVAIRSAVSVGKKALVYAGAGIVADSIPEKEWYETELKFRPMLSVLGSVSDAGQRR